jgi:hypothetical protein
VDAETVPTPTGLRLCSSKSGSEIPKKARKILETPCRLTSEVSSRRSSPPLPHWRERSPARVRSSDLVRPFHRSSGGGGKLFVRNMKNRFVIE